MNFSHTHRKKYGFLQAAFLTTAICMLPFFSCKVGLGSAVDTTPPSSAIIYPPKNAVVRSTFVIAGTCSDDTNIESVTVHITNTDTKKLYGPFQADLASDRKSWSITLNKEKQEVPNHPYAGWEYPDGKYSVTAYATDTVGKNSDTAVNAFTIDNTPPILILTSPSSSGTLEPDKFGRTISFTGTYAEDTDNKIAEMKVRLFKKSDASKIGEISFENIDHMAENNKYVIAQYFSKPESDLTNEEKKLFENYKAIFGEDKVNEYTTNNTAADLPVYMTLLLSDGARVYNDPSNAQGSGPGNETTYYYRNTDSISDNFTKESAKYPMSILDIKDFLNGTSAKYTEDTAVAEIKTALEAAQSAPYTAEASELAAADRQNAATLSINPKANPVFIVSGYQFDTSNTSPSYVHGFPYYTNDAPFTITISSGADKVPVHYTSNKVTVYAVPAESNGEFTNPLPANWSSEEPPADPLPLGWLKIKTIENQGNKTSYTITESLSGLTAGKHYRFAVWGKDMNGMQIEEDKNGPYVFVVKATGALPQISIDGQDITGGKHTNLEEGTIISGNILASSFTPDENKLIFTGTASSESGPITKVEAKVVSIENLDTPSAPVPSHSLSLSPDSPSSPWKTIVTESASHPLSEGNYKVTLKFTVEDTVHKKSSIKRTIYIDKKPPEISIDNITSNKCITEEDSYIQTIKDSSGAVTGRRYSFRGKWSDVKGKGTKTLEYSTDGGANWHSVTDSVNGSAVPEVTAEASWAANIDVTEGKDYHIKFRAIDDSGLQKETGEVTGITFDFSVPTIGSLEAKVNTAPETDVAGKYVNKAMVGKTLTVKTTVSDNFSLGSDDTAVKNNITAAVEHNGTAYSGSDLTVTKTPSSDKKSADVVFSFTIPSDGTKNGEWLFKVEAKDAAGITAVKAQSVGVTVDTTDPTWKTDNTAIKPPYISSAGSNGWYNTTALQVKAFAEDNSGGSGIDKLQYTLNNASDWTDVGNGNFTFTVSDVFNGTITVRAIDKAGNTVKTDIPVKIDTAAPNSCTLGTVDGESGITAKLINKDTNQVAFTFTASDASGGSGLKSAEVIKIGNKPLTPPIAATESSGTYQASIPKAQLADGAVTVQLTDNAGNTADFALFTLQLDNTLPTVKINTPAAGTAPTEYVTVNKTITVSGTASDNREIVNNVEVFIKTAASGSTNEWAKYNVEPAITGGDWTFEFDTNNTAAPVSGGIGTYDSDSMKNGRQLTFKITAKDAAGNVKPEERTVTVDQNTDRPVIRFTNLPLTGMTAANPVWLKGSNIIYGGITDDDGEVKSLKYSTDNGSNWNDITVSGGSWNVTLPDGSATILFKVKDAKDTEFTSGESESTNAPKLTDGTATFAADSKLYLKVDTHAPEVQNVQISRNGTDWSSDFKTAGGNELKLGGKTDSGDSAKGGSEKFYIKFEAKDANGIDENKLSIKVSNLSLDDGTPVPEHTYTTAAASGSNETHVTDGTSVSITKTSPTTDGWITYTFSNIPCKTGSGTMKLDIAATDKAGNTSPIARDAKVDNTAPKVEFSSPTTKTSSGISPTKGNARVSGEIDDNKAEVWFAVSPSGTVSPDRDSSTDNSYTYAKADGSEHIGTISSFDQNKTVYKPVKDISARWYVMFDDDMDSAAVGTHSLTLNKWLIELGITTQNAIDGVPPVDRYEEITKLYIWIKAKDAHGNTKEYKFPIWHDPQGDRPSVVIDYPLNGAKLGGTVRLAGNATDNDAPTAVFVQILRNEHGVPSGQPTVDDLNYWKSKNYPVYLMSGNGSAGTEWTGTLESGKTAADYGILATLNGGSWSLPINENGEFNPSGNTPNNVKITAYAYDEVKSGTSNKSLPKSVNVTFDKNNPVFENVFLVKSADENISANSNAQQITASGGTYSVKDTWYIYGSVTDADTIKKLTIKDKGTSHQLITSGTESSSSGKWAVEKTSDGKTAKFKYKLDTKNGVGECSIDIEAYDATNQGYNSKYTLTIKYDNEVPVLIPSSDAGYNIKADISQSDSFYTFGSKVREDAVGGKAQSGFKRLAFFFMRRTGSTACVYDPMLVKTDSKNKLSITESDKDSGLYWKKYNSVSWSSSSPADLAFTTDANVHTGGLVQANGVIYRIQSVSSTGITLDANLATNPGSTVKIALALVVDHVSAEGGLSSYPLETDGYYSAAHLLNDDGDRMIESVSKTGTEWTWEASICSRNIPDGPIELHYVAFDEAGNYATDVVNNAKVSNNRPRIAGVTFGTDYNGNGTIEDGEKITAYRAPKTKGEYDTNNGDNVPGIKSLTGFTGGGTNSNDKAVYDFSRTQYKYPSRKAEQLNPKQPNGEPTPVTLDVKDEMTVRGYTEITPEIVGGNGKVYYEYNLPGIGNGVNTAEFITSGTEDYTIAEGTIKLQLGDILKLSDENAQSEKTLSFTFWDSTEGAAAITTAGTGWQAGRQSAALNVKMKFAAKTPAEPKTTIQPFYWNSESDNSLYENKRENGHLEVESGLPAAFSGNTGVMDGDPKVSGQIVMRGTAHDDSFIEGLYISVPGMESVFGSAGANLTEKTVGTAPHMITYYKAAEVSSGHLTGKNEWNNHGFKFEVSNEKIGKNGHDVNWAFSWDTSKITGIAKTDVEVHVLAYNKGTPACAENTSKDTTYKHASVNGKKYYADATYATPKGSTPDTEQTKTGALKNRYRMDVVPYIRSVSRKSTYNTKRARSGAIPLLRGEVDNTLTGFNFGESSPTLKITENKNGTGSELEMTDLTLSSDKKKFTFKVPDTAKDGYLHLVVNGVPALNNMNGYTAGNTEESDTYGTAKHSDDRLVHIWRVNEEDTFKGSKNAIYPAMSKDSDGTLYASFSNYSKSEVYYSNAFTGGGAVKVGEEDGATKLFTGYDPPEETDITVSGTEVNVLYAANYHGGNQWQWGDNTGIWNDTNPDNAGGIYLYDKDAANTYIGHYRQAKIYRFELFTYDNELQQFKNIRALRSGDNIYVVYYDRLTGAVKFAWVDDSKTPSTSGKALPWCVIDGNTDVTDTDSKVPDAPDDAVEWQKIFTFVNPDGSTAAAKPYVLSDFEEGLSVSSAVWESIALTVTTQGYPVVVYMDSATGSLRLARSTSKQPSSPNHWTIQKVLADSDSNAKIASDYINACVGNDGVLHIAFQNTKGQLVYVKSTNKSDTGSAKYTFGKSEVLDDSGMSIDMTMDGTTPYITYVSRPNSYDAIRIAYKTSMDFNNNGADVEGWETMTAPLNQRPANSRICIETQAKHYVSSGGTASKLPVAVGFKTNSDYRAAFYVGK
ncbi:MAG: hypothetical protein ACTTH8_05865 [Treponema sp.]